MAMQCVLKIHIRGLLLKITSAQSWARDIGSGQMASGDLDVTWRHSAAVRSHSSYIRVDQYRSLAVGAGEPVLYSLYLSTSTHRRARGESRQMTSQAGDVISTGLWGEVIRKEAASIHHRQTAGGDVIAWEWWCHRWGATAAIGQQYPASAEVTSQPELRIVAVGSQRADGSVERILAMRNKYETKRLNVIW